MIDATISLNVDSEGLERQLQAAEQMVSEYVKRMARLLNSVNIALDIVKEEAE